MPLPTEMSSLILAFSLSAVLSALLLAVWVRSRLARRRHNARLMRLEDDMAILQAGNIGLGKKVLSLNRQLQLVSAGAHTTVIDAASGGEAGWSRQTANGDAGGFSRPTSAQPARKSASHLHAVPSDSLTAAETEPFEPEFERAQRLLGDGADIAQVVHQTGLTRSEVELIQLLHPLAGRR